MVALAPGPRRGPLLGSLAAGFFSALGNAVAMVALPWFVLELTNSPAQAGLVAAAGIVPLILGVLFGGTIVERFGPRRVAVCGDLLSAATVAAVPLLHRLDALNLPLLLLLIAAGAVLDGPTRVAADSRRPELARLARMRLERATSFDEMLMSLAALTGPALAGVAIAAFGMAPTLYLTAACSLAAACLDAVSLPGARRRRLHLDHSGWRGAMAGLRFVLSQRLLRALVVLATAFVAAFGAIEAVVMPALYRAQGGAAIDLGLFLSAAGGASALAALGYALYGHRLSRRAVFLGGCALLSLAVAILALAPPSWRILAGALAGFGAGPLAPIENAELMRRAPQALRSHALGAVAALSLASLPLAMIGAGATVEYVGARPLLTGAALLLGALTWMAWRGAPLRALDGAPARAG
ncbi:MFS transporter [Lysobacter sp. CA199]|uniref:MFS transporter n=1 Tax=Lysobacter sp. CA199 TaxID=3455608 RepID=UPI003F8D5E6B